MSFIKPLVNEIDGADYNNKLARMKFSKSETEPADQAYEELGDKSFYFNPESKELYAYENNQSMYEDLKDDLNAYKVERTEGKGANRTKRTVETFAGSSKYFNPELALEKLQSVIDAIKEKPKSKLSEDEISLIRSFSGAKPFINAINNKRSFVVFAPDFIQEKIDSLNPALQREGREEFMFFKSRILAFNQDPHKVVRLQKGNVQGANECEMSTNHKQPNSRDHFHMKVGGYFTDENGVLKPVKIKWSNHDDGNGYTEALENFIHNDPVLVEKFGESLKSYSVFAAQGSATSTYSIPTINTPSTQTQPAKEQQPSSTAGVNTLDSMIKGFTQTGQTDFTTPGQESDDLSDDELPDDDTGVFEQSQNKAIQTIVDTDTEKQANNALAHSGLSLKEPTGYEGEELEADTRNLLDAINKQIGEVNRMYADVVKERILPLMHANNALVTSQELVLTNKKLVVANKSNATKILNLEDENKNLSESLKATNETVEKQDEEIKGYIEKNSLLSTSVVELEDKVKQKDDELDNLNREVDDLETSLNHTKGRYKQALSIASQRKKTIDALNSNIEILSSDISAKDIEISSLKDSMSAMKASHKEEIIRIDTENALTVSKLNKDHEKELKTKDETISQLTSSVNSLNENIKQLKENALLKDETITSQKELLDNNKGLIVSQKESLTAKDLEIAQLQSDIKEALGYKEKAERLPEVEKELKETKEIKDESGKLLKEFLKIAGDHIPKAVFEEMIKKSGTSLIDDEAIRKIYKDNKNAPKNG